MNDHFRITTIGSYLTRRQAMRNYARLGRVYCDWVDRECLPYGVHAGALLTAMSPMQAAWLVKFCNLFERATSV